MQHGKQLSADMQTDIRVSHLGAGRLGGQISTMGRQITVWELGCSQHIP